MTIDEAKKICAVIATADGGCHVCVSGLVDEFNNRFDDVKLAFRQTDEDDFVEVVEFA